MYSKMVSISMVIVLLAVYSVEQASALRCYGCESNRDGLCWTSPTSDMVYDCASTRHLTANSTVRAVIAERIEEKYTALKYSNDCECMTMVGTVENADWVLRTCTLIDVPCAELENALGELMGYEPKSCTRCNHDLCNSQAARNV